MHLAMLLYVHFIFFLPIFFSLLYCLWLSLRALHIGSTSKFSSEQRHDLISTTFQCCSNARLPLGWHTSDVRNRSAIPPTSKIRRRVVDFHLKPFSNLYTFLAVCSARLCDVTRGHE